MKTATLSTVYLDDEPVGLMGDPRPPVFKIIIAAGQKPEQVHVLRSQSAHDAHGHQVALGDIIDRTAAPTNPIYLRCVPKPTAARTGEASPSAPVAKQKAPGRPGHA